MKIKRLGTMTLTIGPTGVAATLADVVDRHDGKVITPCLGGWSSVRIELARWRTDEIFRCAANSQSLALHGQFP
jgi:hypothetical protein